jgi:hypothetical protein
MKEQKSYLRVLHSSDTPIEELMKRTPATDAVDQMFLANARKALAAAGYGAIEFLAANPAVSETELAKRLNRGVTTLGLIMAIYDEAARTGVVRETAKDLLIRHICNEFPGGWSFQGDVRPVIRIASWDRNLDKCFRDSPIADYSARIVRHLGVDDPPPEGWIPKLSNDQVIDGLFDRYWPVDTGQGVMPAQKA